jgi:hypothetical protein
MKWSGWLACRPWGAGLLVAACGGAASPSTDQGPWPPLSLGGSPRIPGPTEDLALNPETGMPYDDIPFCAGATRLVEAGEQIELNEGAYIGRGVFARWQGSYRCDTSSSSGAAGPTLQVAVRLIDQANSTCPGDDGGVVIAAAEVSLQLIDVDGATLHDGPCASPAYVSAWPGRTNLRVDCVEVALEVRADWLRMDQVRAGGKETKYYTVQCQRADGS